MPPASVQTAVISQQNFLSFWPYSVWHFHIASCCGRELRRLLLHLIQKVLIICNRTGQIDWTLDTNHVFLVQGVSLDAASGRWPETDRHCHKWQHALCDLCRCGNWNQFWLCTWSSFGPSLKWDRRELKTILICDMRSALTTLNIHSDGILLRDVAVHLQGRQRKILWAHNTERCMLEMHISENLKLLLPCLYQADNSTTHRHHHHSRGRPHHHHYPPQNPARNWNFIQ